MKTQALATLLKLRHAAVDEAKRAIATALSHEAAADAVLAEAEAAIARETTAAISSAEDADVEAFASWLPQGQRKVTVAAEAAAAAAGATAEARATLSLARAAARATETMIEKELALLHQAADRRAQAALDEVGNGRHRRSGA